MDGGWEVMDVREIQNMWWRESLGRWSRRPWVLAEARCGQAVAWRVEPWLAVELRLDGSAWLSCGSHSTERKAGKCLKLD
ncbi:hypothetical protein CDL15_Pgr023432 [Punica granatum]|uniref:Uncharacterized protein n=1 Tax=Punica granatum TaxID=22663 RepID=A0A218XXK2_PUNGR|nr:hypothetical protein CDL15_Pgr023432 [Punica granatum]